MGTRIVYYKGIPYKFITRGENFGCNKDCCFLKECNVNKPIYERIDPDNPFAFCNSLPRTPYYHFEEIPIAKLLKEIKDENSHNK